MKSTQTPRTLPGKGKTLTSTSPLQSLGTEAELLTLIRNKTQWSGTCFLCHPGLQSDLPAVGLCSTPFQPIPPSRRQPASPIVVLSPTSPQAPPSPHVHTIKLPCLAHGSLRPFLAEQSPSTHLSTFKPNTTFFVKPTPVSLVRNATQNHQILKLRST